MLNLMLLMMKLLLLLLWLLLWLRLCLLLLLVMLLHLVLLFEIKRLVGLEKALVRLGVLVSLVGLGQLTAFPSLSQRKTHVAGSDVVAQVGRLGEGRVADGAPERFHVEVESGDVHPQLEPRGKGSAALLTIE